MDLSISWVDIFLLLLLAASVLLGLWRGLVFELLSLLGWVVAYFACPFLAPWIEAWLPADRMGPTLLHVAGLVLAFVVIIIAWGLAAKLLRALIQASPLSVLDRLLGAGFGVLRGVLVCLLLVVIVSMTPAVGSHTWQASLMAPRLQQLLHEMRPVLPVDLVKLLPAEA